CFSFGDRPQRAARVRVPEVKMRGLVPSGRRETAGRSAVNRMERIQGRCWGPVPATTRPPGVLPLLIAAFTCLLSPVRDATAPAAASSTTPASASSPTPSNGPAPTAAIPLSDVPRNADLVRTMLGDITDELRTPLEISQVQNRLPDTANELYDAA